MSLYHRWIAILAGTIAVTLLAISPSTAFDALWSTVLSESVLSASELQLSLLNLAGGTGLQFATAGAAEHGGKGIRFGLGFDDMVAPSRNPLDDAGNVPMAVSDRLFLLTTPCDKRFQFTLQITW
jgi:hypothetical protein